MIDRDHRQEQKLSDDRRSQPRLLHSGNALSESTLSVLNDGRLLYTRWKYVYKGVIAVQPLWAMQPGPHSQPPAPQPPWPDTTPIARHHWSGDGGGWATTEAEGVRAWRTWGGHARLRVRAQSRYSP